MRTASITEAKNGLSALIDLVKRGDSVLILERGIPVAKLAPLPPSELDDDARGARLERKGIIRRGRRRGPSQRILNEPGPRLPDGASLLEAVLEERRSGW